MTPDTRPQVAQPAPLCVGAGKRPNAAQGTCKSIRQALEDCYIVITGEEKV